MDYIQFVKDILQGIFIENQEGKKYPQEPLKKMKIGKVKSNIIKNAKDIGIDIEGYHHEISNYFIRHVLNSHGEEKKETSRGNISIANEDFLQIPVIIDSPDCIIFGARRNSEDRIIYIKHLEIGTLFYFEEILTGKSNKTLRGNTMYKSRKKLDKAGIIANIVMNGKTDVSKNKNNRHGWRPSHQYSQPRLTKRQPLPFFVLVPEHPGILSMLRFSFTDNSCLQP